MPQVNNDNIEDEVAAGAHTQDAINKSSILASTGKYELATVYKLALCNKRLKTMQGLEGLSNLVELDLSGNSIAQISGLQNCLHLQKLVLAKNRLTAVDSCLASLTKLEHLLLQGNLISTIASLNLRQLCKLKRLSTLYLKNVNGTEACQCCHAKEYKRTVLSSLPKLKNLDGERNPHSSTCFSALMEKAAAVHEEMERFEPDFSFPEPEPWIDACMLQLPELPPISHYDVVSTVHHRIASKADWFMREINQLSHMVHQNTNSCNVACI